VCVTQQCELSVSLPCQSTPGPSLTTSSSHDVWRELPDALSAGGCVVTYVPRLWDGLRPYSVDLSPEEVPIGASLTDGATRGSVVVDVPFPAPDGAMSLLVSA
jgi:hypothetical protein